MKLRLLVVCCLVSSSLTYAQTTLYVSPSGSASNSGTSISAPTTLAVAITTVTAGGTIYMRGGTYSYSASAIIDDTNNGTASANKNITAYNGEVPVLDFSGQAVADANRGFVLDGDYWHVTGLTITGAGDNGMLLSGNGNTIEKCIFSKNHDSGLQLSRYKTTNATLSTWPSNNLVLNCEAFDNQDAGNENADGFAAKLTCGTGNVFRGCISHNNIDDGWDFYAKSETGPIGPVTLENCVSYGNGTLSTGSTSGSGDKNGFKLGGSGIAVNHIVRRCIAFNNGHHGFTDNDNPGNIEVSNNTSYNNAESNFNFRTGSTATFRNNLSYNAGSSDKSNGTDVGTSNVWWKNNVSTNSGSLVVSSADFVTLTPSVTKNTDGSPNTGNFLSLVSTSDLINAGVTASGITYSGSAPDIGAKEYGGSTGGGGTTPVTYTLTTTASPSNGGTITRSPDSASYTSGRTVTLTATPASGYTFSSWSGGASGTSATVSVVVTANTSVTANFTATSTGGGNTLRIDDAASSVSGYCGADGSRQNTYSGADGGYYINLSNSASKGINYYVSVPAAGTYSFVWRYAHGTTNGSYTARLLVNGSTAVSSISFPATGAWTTWTTTGAVTAALSAGVNVIRLETTASAEFAIIDWLEVTGTSPTAASCSASIGSLSAVVSAAPSLKEESGSNASLGVYPNPANNYATVQFTTRKAGVIAVQLYNANGQLVQVIANKSFPAGLNKVGFGCGALSAGAYFIRIDGGGLKATTQLLKQ
ncbi:Listeria/Bacterioides repeat-containing protein/Por secretion system C-terminal sorting domain-containing protein [Filimonas lacunae]|uniref:Listeria/Bacterioides repeat-containing protein/Por secretion system C-terminal sorting domain-containing protein n=1 Tax=Filimonas lacunae TaxID=477680 RepID=A0A173MCM5_9BACT|nr:T9SS type A sorting domain-containing protein [Filimonas lacunae]BAV05305.1 pectate lyase precursor [Filimonas lacunae]SIT22077.1 Listeria/Bacterioides repeat-containing protein/Por secretion system C-terminal sorting domain-containing protein [Filimonas lacunae]